MTTDDTPTTQFPQTPVSPSSADVPTTTLTPEEAEAIGLTDAMTRPFPAVGATEGADTGSSAAASAATSTAWSAPTAAAASPEAAPAPDAPRREQSDADAVWHGPIEPLAADAPSGPNPPAIVWGLVLLVVAALLVAVVAGARIDPVTAGIVVLAGSGAALLLVALLPRGRHDRTVD